MDQQVIVAAVGTNGRHAVVWGVGVASTESGACDEALNEARHELRQAGCSSELRMVQIDQARRERIEGGDVDAEDL